MAKQGLRVLVLGQGEPEPTYSMRGYELARNPFPHLGLSSPPAERVIETLGLQQAVRQRIEPRNPALQVVLENHRFDLSADEAVFHREIAREFPELRRAGEDLRRTLIRVNDELDDFTRGALCWPPETFLERQRFARALSLQRYNRAGHGWHALANVPEGHRLRKGLVGALTHLAELPANRLEAFGATRLLGHLLTGSPGRLQGGWPWLRSALIERIRTYSGDVRLADRATEIETSQGKVTAVTLARSGDEVGCGNLVVGTAVSDLLQLASDRSRVLELFERVGEPIVNSFRYTVNVVMKQDALPKAWRSDLLLQKAAGESTPLTLWIESRIDEDRSIATLCIATLVPSHVVEEASYTLATYRERIMDALRTLLPFVDKDLIIVDSPHDGLPPDTYQAKVEPESNQSWDRGAHAMNAIYDYPSRPGMGVCGLPARTPIRGLVLCNSQVVPGLGFEGAFLAASSVSSLVARRYSKQDWMRRGLWSTERVG